ncbi:hypothetical protein BOO71_0000100 [Deinococcus marmoris]|uniref:CAAX prenyl protease 2/Lysostaphin resistance protein A-like domain-containing protein n=1 Tax=Deinococcus marmoris TaxID=249408 RepID=A0A1U7P5C0_9DEIO|nr:hypothetical protein BOO71_0000100 [Deinococcus marmoris]
MAGVLCLIVAGLGWWQAVGFRKSLTSSLKFFVFPVIFLLGFYGVLTFYSVSQGAVDVFTWGVLSVSAAYVANFLLVGFAEELMFRGILFEAFRTRLTPLLTVLGTAVIFASVHLINLVHGASLQGTTDQIINAFAVGVMMGALRLRVASIYPLMLFHAVWDIVTADFEITQTTGTTAPTPAVTDAVEAGSTLSPVFILQVLVPLLYGLFVYWRYSKSVKAGKISDRPALLNGQTTLNPAV